MVRLNLTGQRFGRLVAILPTDRRKYGKVVWLCKCDCGNFTHVPTNHLKQNNVRSCGCLGRETSNDNLKSAHKSLRKDTVNGTRLSMLTAKKGKGNTSGHRGVSQSKVTGQFEAYIYFKNKKIYLGSFETFGEAVDARKKAEEKYFKPFLDKHK